VPAQATQLGALGAVPVNPERVAFRVWAPNATSIAVRTGGRDHELAPEGGGMHAGEVDARAGDDYTYVLDGERELPDPVSRWQSDGLRGPSRVLDTGAFRWTDGDRASVTLEELVLYELHVGTFSPEGTFDGVVPRLSDLRALGATAIELMPVATFPGERGWGYDGVLTWAPHHAYGGPQGLARLVDAAHAEGLAVFLDVVYNHLGPGAELVTAFGPYHTDRESTPWGSAMDYRRRAVREWAIQNAELWVRDYHVDGLRLDSVFHVFDDGEPHVLAELAARVHAIDPSALVVSEARIGDLRPIERWGHDAQWADALHHALHAALTGERDGYYAPFGTVQQVADELLRSQAGRFVAAAQNHDQVGNRAFGDRLTPEQLRVAAAVVLLSPATPLLFQGEEHAERAPFLFFSDHDDPFIADATREGRRREFADFGSFSGEEIPDPQAEETFRRSRLDPASGDPRHRAFYEELLAHRRRLHAEPIDVDVDEAAKRLVLRRGDVELVAHFDLPRAELRRR